MITRTPAGGIELVCSGAVSSEHDELDVRLVVVGLDVLHARPMCGACRASAERLGLPFREYVGREPDRRRGRFLLPGESLGRRATDALAEAWRTRMA